jgi:tellurite resistance protein
MLIRGRKSLGSTSLTRDAIVDVAVLAMLIDGEATDDEAEMLGGTLSQQDAFQGVSGEQLEAMMDRSAARIEEWDDLEVALEHITESIGTNMGDREVAFGIAYSIACADGEIADEEDEFLSALADSLELSQDRVDALIEAVNEALESAGEEEEEEEEEEEPPSKHWLSKRGAERPKISLKRA